MRVMLETTQWADATPNHVYVFTDSLKQAIAYVPAGTRTVKRFSRPMDIDRRGRTFVELTDDQPPQAQTVQGSRGETYYLTESDQGWSCSCPGYQYRGTCKHSQELEGAVGQ